jgi:predicted AlkP superfamily pyrophosphatase or phosphodiesterase
MKDTIKRSAIPPALFFPRQTFYQLLRAKGIEAHILQYRSYALSTYSDIVFRGAQVYPYTSLQEAFSCLSELVTRESATPAYYFLYIDRIDAACHNYGPYSRAFDEAVDSCLTSIDQMFYQQVRGKVGRTLLMMTADHGQVEVDPRSTYYLNKQVPGIARSLKVNKRGNLLVPAGSARDMFLHVKDESVDMLVNELRQRLAGKAEVYHTQELLEQHFFGRQTPSSVFMERVGNVVILPYKHETVWWYEEGKFAMHFQGHHGGLTPEEMEIPLLLLPL